MALNQETLLEIRKKQSREPFIWLIEFFDNTNEEIKRLTNYEKVFVYKQRSYTDFPFLVIIPNISDDITQSVQLAFANFKTNLIKDIKQTLFQTKKIILYSVNVKFPENDVFQPSVFYYNQGDYINVDDRTIRATFSRRNLGDRSYPYRRYNSEDHPTLYQDFNEVFQK